MRGWFMDYGIWIMDFLYIIVRIKPEIKWCWFQINAGVISLYVGCPIVVGLYQYWWVGQCLVLFYIHFHYQIRINDFRYEIRFWWSVNGFCYENRITNKSRQSLSCHTIRYIISIMEMEFIVYNLVFVMKMTVYTIWLMWLKGRASAMSFYG